MRNHVHFETQLTHQIRTILKTVMDRYGFETPIGLIVEGANGCRMVGTYQSDGPHLAFEVEQDTLQAAGFQFPIRIEFHDGATRRAALLRIEAERKWDSAQPGICAGDTCR